MSKKWQPKIKFLSDLDDIEEISYDDIEFGKKNKIKKEPVLIKKNGKQKYKGRDSSNNSGLF